MRNCFRDICYLLELCDCRFDGLASSCVEVLTSHEQPLIGDSCLCSGSVCDNSNLICPRPTSIVVVLQPPCSVVAGLIESDSWRTVLGKFACVL